MGGSARHGVIDRGKNRSCSEVPYSRDGHRLAGGPDRDAYHAHFGAHGAPEEQQEGPRLPPRSAEDGRAPNEASQVSHELRPLALQEHYFQSGSAEVTRKSHRSRRRSVPHAGLGAGRSPGRTEGLAPSSPLVHFGHRPDPPAAWTPRSTARSESQLPWLLRTRAGFLETRDVPMNITKKCIRDNLETDEEGRAWGPACRCRVGT